MTFGRIEQGQMKVLLSMDRKNYDPSLPRFVRYSANSIISKNDKVAMIFIGKYNFYAFPGGGVEDGETLIDALIRETEEEAGLIIKPTSIVELGKIVEIRKDRYAEGIYERHDHFYFCDVEDISVTPRLTQSEIEYGHQFLYVAIDEAIAANEMHMQQGSKWTEGITFILELLRGK